MMWCIKHIETILDARPTTDTWTLRWLEILKEEASKGFMPEMPEYGFGDPKSYGIMEQAAKRLIDTGAVRHGSECFNYYFPQEIDDMFLLISDTLSPVPWKYVNVTDLQALLSQKIAEGFVFPLNPKWILCDPGWKRSTTNFWRAMPYMLTCRRTSGILRILPAPPERIPTTKWPRILGRQRRIHLE